MKQGRYAKIIQQGAAVYLGEFPPFQSSPTCRHHADLTAAVLEYLVAEMVELSGNAARDSTSLSSSTLHYPSSIHLLPISFASFFDPNSDGTDDQTRNPESIPDSLSSPYQTIRNSTSSSAK
jgi:hypothetical protein